MMTVKYLAHCAHCYTKSFHAKPGVFDCPTCYEPVYACIPDAKPQQQQSLPLRPRELIQIGPTDI